MRLLSQTPAGLTHWDLSCFVDWAISSAASITGQSCTQGCNLHRGPGTRISVGLRIIEFLLKLLWLSSLILNVRYLSSGMYE